MTGGRAFPVAALLVCAPVVRVLLAGDLDPDAAALRAGMGFVVAWVACALLGVLVARYRSILDGAPEKAPAPGRRRDDPFPPGADDRAPVQ